MVTMITKLTAITKTRRFFFGCLFVAMGVLCVAASDESRVADAAMNGDKAAVRTLLKQGLDVNAAQGDGMTALHWAARQGDVETARMLIYAGANVKAATRLGAQCGGIRTPALDLAAHPLPLTVREREIANLVAAGLSNREIADRLVVSVRTVEGHLYRACIKLDISDREDLAAMIRTGASG